VLRDAQRGSYFETLPPVLTLHLQRFVWDVDTGNRVKVCDKFVCVFECVCMHMSVCVCVCACVCIRAHLTSPAFCAGC